MICRLVLQFDLYSFSVQIVCSSYKDPNDGLEPGCLASRLASCLVVFTTADVDLEGRVRTVFKVLIRHFLCSWQSGKTPGGGSFGHPRQEECLSHTPSTCHTCTLHIALQQSYNVHDVSHSPSSGSSVNEKLRAGHRAETRQTW